MHRSRCLFRKLSGAAKSRPCKRSSLYSCRTPSVSCVALVSFICWECAGVQPLAFMRQFSCSVRNKPLSIWRWFPISLNSNLHLWRKAGNISVSEDNKDQSLRVEMLPICTVSTLRVLKHRNSLFLIIKYLLDFWRMYANTYPFLESQTWVNGP